MLKIRLQRVGRKAEPSFRLVLTDSKNSTKSGKYLETLGNYDARKGEKAEFKTDRVQYWMSKGAQVSGTVHNLLVSKKVLEGKKINVLPLKKAIVKDVPAEVAPAAEAPAVPASEVIGKDVVEEKVEETVSSDVKDPGEAIDTKAEATTEEAPVAEKTEENVA